MANPYPALITDANSETRVAGQITFTDPANQPGAPPTTKELVNNAAGQGVDPNTFVQLNWVHADHDQLLDLTDPANPTPIAAGTYAVCATIGLPAAAGKQAIMSLYADLNGDAVAMNQVGPLDGPAVVGSRVWLAASLTYHLDPGQVVAAFIQHNAAGTLAAVEMQASIQRLA